MSYDDVQYNVRVVADAVPDLELLEPTSSGLATVNKRLNIKSHGSDDYGLAQGWLVYSVTGESQERRLPIRNFQGGAGEQFSFATALDGLIDGLQEKFEQSAETGGLQISLAVEVADLMGTTTFKVDESSGALSAHAHGLNNDQPVMLTTTGELPEPLKAGVVYWVTQADENGFQLAAAEGGDAIALATSGEGEHRYGSLASWQERTRRSATRHLTIVDDERYMQWYRTELASQHDEIKRAQGIEQVSSTKIKEIKVQEGDAE